MTRMQTLQRVYKLSFQSPQGHNLRQACLIAMGKVKMANEGNVEEVVEDLEQSDPATQEMAKLAVIGEMIGEVVAEEHQKLNSAGLNTVLSWMKKAGIALHDVQDILYKTTVNTPTLMMGKLLEKTHKKLESMKSPSQVIKLLAQVLSAQTPQELCEAQGEDWQKFVQSFKGDGPDITDASVVVAITEEMLDTQKSIFKWGLKVIEGLYAWVTQHTLGAVVHAVMHSFGVLIVLGVLFGWKNTYMIFKKLATTFIHLPLAIITDINNALKWGWNKIKDIFTSAGTALSSWFKEETQKTANRRVIREFKKLASIDTQFYKNAQKVLLKY